MFRQTATHPSGGSLLARRFALMKPAGGGHWLRVDRAGTGVKVGLAVASQMVADAAVVEDDVDVDV